MCIEYKNGQYIKETRIIGYCKKYDRVKTLSEAKKDGCIDNNFKFCDSLEYNNKNPFLKNKFCKLLKKDYPELYLTKLKPIIQLSQLESLNIHKYDIFAYFDASFNMETKISGLSFVITDSNNDILYKNLIHDYCYSNNDAEFEALKTLIDFIEVNINYFNGKILILGDSKTVINIIENNMRPRDILYEKQVTLKNKYSKLRKNNNISIKWIKGKYNKIADRLSKSAAM